MLKLCKTDCSLQLYLFAISHYILIVWVLCKMFTHYAHHIWKDEGAVLGKRKQEMMESIYLLLIVYSNSLKVEAHDH